MQNRAGGARAGARRAKLLPNIAQIGTHARSSRVVGENLQCFGCDGLGREGLHANNGNVFGLRENFGMRAFDRVQQIAAACEAGGDLLFLLIAE